MELLSLPTKVVFRHGSMSFWEFFGVFCRGKIFFKKIFVNFSFSAEKSFRFFPIFEILPHLFFRCTLWETLVGHRWENVYSFVKIIDNALVQSFRFFITVKHSAFSFVVCNSHHCYYFLMMLNIIHTILSKTY